MAIQARAYIKQVHPPLSSRPFPTTCLWPIEKVPGQQDATAPCFIICTSLLLGTLSALSDVDSMQPWQPLWGTDSKCRHALKAQHAELWPRCRPGELRSRRQGNMGLSTPRPPLPPGGFPSSH